MKRYQCQISGGICAVFLSFGTRSRLIWNAIIHAVVYHLEPGLEHLKCVISAIIQAVCVTSAIIWEVFVRCLVSFGSRS